MATDESIEPGKIFVGGLSWETSKEGLEEYFSKFGEVLDSVIMQDPLTKRPRGFGFVTFKEQESVTKVLTHPGHVLDEKKIDPKQATAKDATAPTTTKKIFVGGLANNTTEEELRIALSEFGMITEIDLKFDKNTQRMRGFGFVGFESADTVEKLCKTHFLELNGKMIEMKRAEPRNQTGASHRGGGGGYNTYGYGGRGGYGGGAGYHYGYGSGGGWGQHQYSQQQYPPSSYGYSGYSQPGYGGQYGGQTSGYGAYDAYASGQPTRTTGDQTRSDYSSTGYAYGGQGHMQHDMYGNRSTTGYASSTDSYGTGAYNYDPSTYSYQDPSAGSSGYGGRGGARPNSYGYR